MSSKHKHFIAQAALLLPVLIYLALLSSVTPGEGILLKALAVICALGWLFTIHRHWR